MKHMRTTLLLAAASTVFLASCNTVRYAYSPNAHNVPVLAKQFDSKLSASYSANFDPGNSNTDNRYDHKNNKSNGFDVQGAVAVTDHIAVQGNFYSRSEKGYTGSSNGDSSVVRYKRNLVEFGAGYFTSINKKESVYFQVFGGVGFGKLNLKDAGNTFNGSIYNNFYNANFNKYYLEPAIIFRKKDLFAASLSTRFSLLSFRNIHTDYTKDERIDYKLDSLDHFNTVFLEPAFVNSFGFKKLPGMKIEYQFGLSLALDPNTDGQLFDYRPFNFSIGLTFDIGKLIRGPQEEEKKNSRN